MKKLLIFLAVIVVLFGALVLINQQSNKAKYAEFENNPYGIAPQDLHPETLKKLSDPNYDNIITPEQLQAKLDSKESFFVYYFSATCHYCNETTPILNPMAKELNIGLPKLNLLEYPQSLAIQYGVQNTPTLVYYKDGVEAERIVGGITTGQGGNTAETYKAFLQKHTTGTGS